jgi:hypothetical protein
MGAMAIMQELTISNRFGKYRRTKMFDNLKQFDIILVQYGVVEDAQIDVILASDSLPSKIVLHCPSRMHLLHKYRDIVSLAVVVVRRPVEDILASQERVGWGFAMSQLDYYRRVTPPAGNISLPIASLKYRYWDEVQKHLLREAYEVDYDMLYKHPMFVPKQKRIRFTVNQVEVNKPWGGPIQNPSLTADPESNNQLLEQYRQEQESKEQINDE